MAIENGVLFVSGKGAHSFIIVLVVPKMLGFSNYSRLKQNKMMGFETKLLSLLESLVMADASKNTFTASLIEIRNILVPTLSTHFRSLFRR